MVNGAGYVGACSTRAALSGADDDRFALARVLVTCDMSVAGLAALIESLPRAPVSERLQTRAWRFVRRRAALLHRSRVTADPEHA
jgi:hypothetical protein